MIRFDLLCTNEHPFEGWFKDNGSFEAQASSGALCCPVCGGSEIRKAVMAPAIARSRAESPPEDPRRAKLAEAMRFMRAVQTFVEQNFDNVGERFPEEARKMHLGEQPHREIYGKATQAEAEALRDEGVPISPLPFLTKLDG